MTSIVRPLRLIVSGTDAPAEPSAQTLRKNVGRPRTSWPATDMTMSPTRKLDLLAGPRRDRSSDSDYEWQKGGLRGDTEPFARGGPCAKLDLYVCLEWEVRWSLPCGRWVGGMLLGAGKA